MKLLKRPTFWIVLAFLVFLGYVAAGYSQPAEVQFSNETKGEIKNLRLESDAGSISVASLPAGESIESTAKLASGELKLSLTAPSGHNVTKTFPHTAGPRETVVFHLVETDEG